MSSRRVTVEWILKNFQVKCNMVDLKRGLRIEQQLHFTPAECCFWTLKTVFNIFVIHI